MEDIVRGVPAGIAIGGFAAAVVEANQIAMQALWRFNCLAAEIAWVMAEAPFEQIIREQQRRRQQQMVVEDDAANGGRKWWSKKTQTMKLKIKTNLKTLCIPHTTCRTTSS